MALSHADAGKPRPGHENRFFPVVLITEQCLKKPPEKQGMRDPLSHKNPLQMLDLKGSALHSWRNFLTPDLQKFRTHIRTPDNGLFTRSRPSRIWPRGAIACTLLSSALYTWCNQRYLLCIAARGIWVRIAVSGLTLTSGWCATSPPKPLR